MRSFSHGWFQHKTLPGNVFLPVCLYYIVFEQSKTLSASASSTCSSSETVTSYCRCLPPLAEQKISFFGCLTIYLFLLSQKFVVHVCIGSCSVWHQPQSRGRPTNCPQLHTLPSDTLNRQTTTVSHSQIQTGVISWHRLGCRHKCTNTTIPTDGLFSPLYTSSICIWATGSMWEC